MSEINRINNDLVVDDMVYRPNLTDKWKKGKLPSGWYWVELKEGTFADGKKSIILDYLFEFTNDFERHPYLVESVLAPAPSYEQWQAKLEENTKLKGLLKRAKEVLEDEGDYMIVQEINQVLGENL